MRLLTMIKPLPPTPAEIKAARAAAGLTQALAAVELNLHVRTWQAYEQGLHRMRRRDFDLFRARVGIRT